MDFSGRFLGLKVRGSIPRIRVDYSRLFHSVEIDGVTSWRCVTTVGWLVKRMKGQEMSSFCSGGIGGSVFISIRTLVGGFIFFYFHLYLGK